jgi:hypothetical protein
MFDFAIGSTDPADHAAALAWIVRESGTFFDVDVPRLDDPHTADPQPGIALVKDPGTPDSTLEVAPAGPRGRCRRRGSTSCTTSTSSPSPTCPIRSGRGISLVFPDAGRDRQLQFPFGGEGFTAGTRQLARARAVPPRAGSLRGAHRRPHRPRLTIGLPPGDVQRFRLSSSMTHDDLDLFGFWRLLPPRSGCRRGRGSRRGRVALDLHALRRSHARARRPATPRGPRPTVLHATRPRARRIPCSQARSTCTGRAPSS